MIFVIADDITGAAEIAGLGHAYGLTTTLLTRVPEALPQAQLIVLATDTRSMNEMQAIAETRHICQSLQKSFATANERLILFKKVDSAVRGHVVSELQTLLENTAYQQVLYLPANPSKGRTIRGGCFYIDDVPVDQTKFAVDPEFPATEASICLRLRITPMSRIRVCDAIGPEDIRQAVRQGMQAADLTLLAGAADLFCGLLEYLGHAEVAHPVAFAGLSLTAKPLIVCGSTQSTDLSSRPYIRKRNIPISSMPRDVFDGNQGAAYWLSTLQVRHFLRTAIQPARNGLILNIPYESSCSAAAALRLRTEMSEVVHALVEKMQPDELIIEGGATAFAVMQRLGWCDFCITEQIAPGVVRMQSQQMPQVHVTFKPGSYPWGEALFDYKY